MRCWLTLPPLGGSTAGTDETLSWYAQAANEQWTKHEYERAGPWSVSMASRFERAPHGSASL